MMGSEVYAEGTTHDLQHTTSSVKHGGGSDVA